MAASDRLSRSRGGVVATAVVGVNRAIDRAARALELELRRLQVSLANRSLAAEARQGLAS